MQNTCKYDQMRINDRKVFMAFCNLEFMSLLAPPSLVTFDPRYVNSSTSPSCCLSILIGWSIFAFVSK